MYNVGVIHGRFQVLHFQHMEYLLEGKSRCRFLYVGITNPDPALTKEATEDVGRSSDDSNPFTYYERLIMLRDALIEAGVARSEFEIVPFPINYPCLIQYYAPRNATYFLSIYDDWGRAKASALRDLGLSTEILWDRPLSEKLITASEVRRLITCGGDWEHLVPKAVARFIKAIDAEKRIRESSPNG
jgi:nicotinamide mononucleotide adenylyltransferase